MRWSGRLAPALSSQAKLIGGMLRYYYRKAA